MNSGVKEVVVSWIRTAVVPPLAAIIVQFLVTNGFDFANESIVINALTFVFVGVWYLVFRGLEVLSENPKVKYWAGVFLGYPRNPRV